MLSYRHAFHAGNFADVFKHTLLLQLVQALRRKDKPFCVLDTHAGTGRYDLHSASAAKNQEYADGIGRLWNQSALGPELSEYREQVRALNPNGELRYYPGSPRLIRTLLRPDDRLILTELHPGDYPVLKAEFASDRQTAVHHADGYAVFKAFYRRQHAADWCSSIPLLNCGMNLTGCLKPCKSFTGAGQAASLRSGIQFWIAPPVCVGVAPCGKLAIPAMLCAELGLQPYDAPFGLHGCGMIIVNPPWQFDELLKRLLPELRQRLHRSEQGETRLDWLTPPPDPSQTQRNRCPIQR